MITENTVSIQGRAGHSCLQLRFSASKAATQGGAFISSCILLS